MKTNSISTDKTTRRSKLIGWVFLLLVVVAGGFLLFFGIRYLKNLVIAFISWLESVASSFDAVVIVALITGTVSLIGVIISSIVAKSIEYKKQRQSYLAQKREKSYGAFVEMVYKIQQNTKNPGTYTENDMIKDILSFSQELTLWGSKKVADKWVQFRLNGANPEVATSNLFLLEEIMNEMRYDLGVKRVKKGNLLSFFVNDVKNIKKVK